MKNKVESSPLKYSCQDMLVIPSNVTDQKAASILPFSMWESHGPKGDTGTAEKQLKQMSPGLKNKKSPRDL